MNNFYGIPKARPEESIDSQQFNLPSEIGRERAYSAVQAEWSGREQQRVLEKLVADNVSKEKLDSVGMLPRDVAFYVFNTDEDDMKDDDHTIAKNLRKIGVDPVELAERHRKTIRERGQLDDERVGLWDRMYGGLLGYFSDPLNVAVNVVGALATGGLANAFKIGSVGGKAALGAFENGMVEALIAAPLKTDLEEKVKGVAFAAGAGAALPALGAGVGAALPAAKKALSKGYGRIFNKSRLTKEVMKEADEVVKRLPEGELKTTLKEEIEVYKELGGKFEDAVEIRAKVASDLEKGISPQGRIEEKLRIELPGGQKVVGKNREDLMRNLTAKLEDEGFDSQMIDDAIERLNEQEFIGNVDRYRVATREIPAAERKKAFIERPDGTKKEIKAKYEHLIYATREEAEAAIEKFKVEDAQVIAQRNGKFAVVQEGDTALQMPGTARFPSRAKAEAKIEEYAKQFGVDEDVLGVEKVPSFSEKYESDYIITNLGSATRFADPERATNTFLDTLSITKFKEVSEVVETIKTHEERMIERAVPESKDIDTIVDQLLNDDTIRFEMETDLKKFNGIYKASKEVLDEIKKGCM